MTVKTSMSLTDRHHRYVARKVEEGAFASASAVVAAAIERLIEDETAQEAAARSQTGMPMWLQDLLTYAFVGAVGFGVGVIY